MAFWVLTLAAVMGAALGFLFLARTWQRPWFVAAAHGVVGAAGLLLLILFPAMPDALAAERGVAAFPRYAAWLFAGALLAGVGVAFRRARRNQGLLIAIHATIAIGAYTLLLAYWTLG